MAYASQIDRSENGTLTFQRWGVAWFIIAVLGAAFYFAPGIDSLLTAWSTPEYSHGPLIPVLSAFLFLRHLKDVPVRHGPVTDRWPGVALLILALLLGGFGRIIQISDFVAYAMIIWVGGMILISFGWRQGWQFWPSVLHLVYMLPLPGVLYYGLSTYLQGVSSELGVYFLQLLGVSVYQDGNIIDLGVYKLHVAEACSGLRYLFPILSFSYIFAVLYRGPIWHKAILLVSAAPITVLMNSIRIAIIGVVVDNYGLAHVEGLSHFLEGWVIFITCVVILFLLAKLLLFLHPNKMSLFAALDLDFDGLFPQAKRIGLIQPSGALIGAAIVFGAVATTAHFMPSRTFVSADRVPFALFPPQVGDWQVGPQRKLTADIEKVLGADDYIQTSLNQPGVPAPVELFIAWYKDQMDGGTHSPKDCLPAGGWEISELEQIDAPGDIDASHSFTLNRALIQKGLNRMLVYYWYDQQGVRTASSFYAKFTLTRSKVASGRSDGALVRLITPIREGEKLSAAEARLQDGLKSVIGTLPQFLPDA